MSHLLNIVIDGKKFFIASYYRHLSADIRIKNDFNQFWYHLGAEGPYCAINISDICAKFLRDFFAKSFLGITYSYGKAEVFRH